MTVRLEHVGVGREVVVVGPALGADVTGGLVVGLVGGAVPGVVAGTVARVADDVPLPHPVRVDVPVNASATTMTLIRPLLVIGCMLRSAGGHCAASPLPDLAR